MIFLLALRSLVSRPVRTAVLAGGFGLGVAVMAALLGIAAVILEQARTPELAGGGDVVVDGTTGRLPNARFALSSLLDDVHGGLLAGQVAAASPIERATLYLIGDSDTVAIRARGGIPSLERAMRDPETAAMTAWTDAPSDRGWAKPEAGDLLREMDRFHPIPDVPAWSHSWAEWLYFNGRSGDASFYLTFLAGPRTERGHRRVGVRLQLEEAGRMTAYSESIEMGEADLLAAAPDLTVKGSGVRLVGHDYRVRLDVPGEAGRERVTGDLVLRAAPGRVLPPIALRGSGGWISGYVVPAMAGTWQGTLTLGGRTLDLSGAAGYHDHNWGFWEGVTWQWGQVQGGGLSFVYGRVRPPTGVADPERIPAFLMALGPDGPLGYSTQVTIDETDRIEERAPRTIVVRARGDAFDVTIELADISSTVRSRLFDPSSNLDFLQMRAEAHVTGRVGDRPIDFRARASAETFRNER